MTAVTTSQWLWYTTRATGIVALVLLTASVVLGVLTSVRFGTRSWPRFTFQDLHRRVSLLAMVFVALHVITTVSDASRADRVAVGRGPLHISPYRRLWLGLGHHLRRPPSRRHHLEPVRQRINPRTWRALHWLAYASWPLAVVHGLGTGTDPHLDWVMISSWVRGRGARCPRVATRRRLASSSGRTGSCGSDERCRPSSPWRPGRHRARCGRAGPFAPERRRRSWPARTRAPALTSARRSTACLRSAVGVAHEEPSRPRIAPRCWERSPRQSLSSTSARLEIKAETSGTVVASVDIVIDGTPDGSGGVALQQSQASLRPPGAPTQYTGQDRQGSKGSRILLSLCRPGRAQLDLRVDVAESGSQVTGELTSDRRGGGRERGFGDGD